MRKYYAYFCFLASTAYLVAAYISQRNVDLTPGWMFLTLGNIALLLDMK